MINLTTSSPLPIVQRVFDIFHDSNKHLFEIKDFLGYGLIINDEGDFEIHFLSSSEKSNELIKNHVNTDNYQIKIPKAKRHINEQGELLNLESMDDDFMIFSLTTRFLVDDEFTGQNNYKVGAKSMGQTYGWRFNYNNVLCGLSCWHSWCEDGNNTPIGTELKINNETEAELYYFEHVSDTEFNYWDFAIAELKNPEKSENKFDYNVNYRVPSQIEFSPRINDIYVKVGYGVPNESEGRFRGLFTGNVQLNGKIYKFKDQILFDRFTNDGDSGAVAFNKKTGEILSLIMGANSKYTIGNPLHIYENWVNRGVAALKDQNGDVLSFVPSFENFDFIRSNSKSVPPSIGGADRRTYLVDLKAAGRIGGGSDGAINLVKTDGDWLYISIHRGFQKTVFGWTHSSTGLLWLDEKL